MLKMFDQKVPFKPARPLFFHFRTQDPRTADKGLKTMRVAAKGGVTVCARKLPNRTTVSLGIAVCSPLDNFVKSEGRKRALAKTNNPKGPSCPQGSFREIAKYAKTCAFDTWQKRKADHASRKSRILAWIMANDPDVLMESSWDGTKLVAPRRKGKKSPSKGVW